MDRIKYFLGRAPSPKAQGRAGFGLHFVSAILFPLFSKELKGSAKPFASLTLLKNYVSIFIFIFFSFSFAQNYEWQPLPTFPGTEDITWNHQNNIAFISCDERRKNSSLHNQNGKILGFYNNQIMNLHSELPFPFHPHGIDYLSNHQQLYVINHRKKKYTTIEVFQFEPNKNTLTHLKTLENKHFISPNDLHVINQDTFIITNDPNGRSIFYLLFNFLFRLKSDKVIFYENGKSQILCKMNYPNGVIKIDNRILISAIYKRRIEVFNIEGKKQYHIKLDSAPDNLEIDENQNLWTATHLHFGKFIKHLKDSTIQSPSKIYKIENPASKNYVITNIPLEYSKISAASVAAPLKNQVLIGCVFDGKILVGRLKE